MILSGIAIAEAVRSGEIVIEPFSESQLGPNSYDFRLGDRCIIYQNHELDSHTQNPTADIAVGCDGLVVKPDRLYLFNTLEMMGSTKFVPIIRGRSSTGR
jgi:dCTP deaminase